MGQCHKQLLSDEDSVRPGRLKSNDMVEIYCGVRRKKMCVSENYECMNWIVTIGKTIKLPVFK